MKIPRILLAAPASGSGKTAVSCALMAAFQERGMKVCACKCGPDYIDPMFHREVLGVDSKNLDLFFSEEEALRDGFIRHASGADLVVTEGVMGYYDGMMTDSVKASSFEVARALDIPVILVLPCRGASLSLAAVARGMIEFMPRSNIRGILINQVSAMTYPRLKQMMERELCRAGHRIPVVGYVPRDDAFSLESRHLGLVTPGEIGQIREQLRCAGEILSRTVDLDAVLSIAGNAPELSNAPGTGPAPAENVPVRIAVARDEAFCFYYKDNLELLEDMGCRMVPFSPLRDAALPEDISGLILGGGYPELYGEALSGNKGMTASIRQALKEKMPCLAECGGFMYLHEELEDQEGRRWPLVGAVKGRTFPTGKLVRFGYVNIERKCPDMESGGGTPEMDREEDPGFLLPGEQIRGHEFHYWDSTQGGTDCMAVKPDGRRRWECVHATGSLFAGYPHLYLPSNPAFARRFTAQCRRWGSRAERIAGRDN